MQHFPQIYEWRQLQLPTVLLSTAFSGFSLFMLPFKLGKLLIVVVELLLGLLLLYIHCIPLVYQFIYSFLTLSTVEVGVMVCSPGFCFCSPGFLRMLSCHDVKKKIQLNASQVKMLLLWSKNRGLASGWPCWLIYPRYPPLVTCLKH